MVHKIYFYQYIIRYLSEEEGGGVTYVNFIGHPFENRKKNKNVYEQKKKSNKKVYYYYCFTFFL